MNKSIKKACIYGRFSAGGNQTEQSLEGQLKVCREYALREGYQIVAEYTDSKLTGKTDRRPEFLRMIADSARGRWEAVIVYQLDRFSRNKYDNAIYKEKLSRNGVKVISAREQISDDASGILMETMLEGMAAYFSIELSQKIQRGREINALKHLSLGSSPGLGFKVIDRQIVVDEANAPHVVRIFEMYANGSTRAEIVDYMNNVGVRTSRGNPFQRTSIDSIMRNERLIGTYKYKGNETPNALPRIINQGLWDKVQQRLAENKGAGGRGKALKPYILSGKLFCGACLSPMTGYAGTSRTKKVHHYYRENSKNCKSLTVKKNEIEDKVIEVVRSMLTEENQLIIAHEISALCEQEQDNPNLKRLQRLIKENNKQKANLLESLKVGKASATAANYVFAEIDKLEHETAELEKQAAIEEDRHYGLSEVDIMYFLSHLKNGNIDDIEYRKLLVNAMVNSVYVHTDDDGSHKLTIVFNASNQPPVKVEVSLLNEIREKTGSSAVRSAPPQQKPWNLSVAKASG